MTKLEAVSAKIIEAVPEIEEDIECCQAYPEHGEPGQPIAKEDCRWCRMGREKGSKRARPIRLADVLIAIGKLGHHFDQIFISEESLSWCYINSGEMCIWELSKSLDDQSEETINFLHSILCK